ncbi:MAG: hypothetical protein Q3997_08660 [Propionibacteriaceae bacterium]|nr:hypothetical protein [Propionibacteriaceae bacterium]
MKKIILPAAAVLAIGAGSLGVAQFALADDQTPNPSASSGADSGRSGAPGERHSRGGKAGMKGIDTTALASKLGVDEAKLTTALDKAREATKPAAGTGSRTAPERSAMRDKLAEALASELGLDKSTVASALEEAHAAAQAQRRASFKTRLSQAVTDGTLTQAEADAVLKAAEAGVIGMGGGRR